MPTAQYAWSHDHLNELLLAPPAAGIDPVDGWELCSVLKPDGATGRLVWFARRDGVHTILRVSPTRFSPSQDRFAWLVENGFPTPNYGLWDDTTIEDRIALGHFSERASAEVA